MIYAAYGKLSKELKNGIISFWVIDQYIILTVLVHNLKTAWPTKFSMSFLSSLDNFFYKMHISFFIKVLIILR